MKLTAVQRNLLESAANKYAEQIGAAEEYLKGRGITLAAARTYRLGVVVDPLAGNEQHIGRLAIPYITRSGVVDIRFRSMDGQEPKYLGLPGATTHLYNVLSTFQASDTIAICEGEIDTITLQQCGIAAVGVPGANNWKKHYTKVLQDFDRVIVFADGDQAGQDFGRHIAKELGFVTIINMPDGEDVNSMFTKYGAQALLERVNNASL